NYHYYPYMHDYIISQELFDASLAKRNAQTVVVFAGFEWEFGRFSFFVQAGVNVFSPFIKELNEVWDLPKQGTLNLWTSNKLGYRYYFYCPPIGRLFIQAAVKANGGTADFLELGVGMRFFRYQGMTNKRANEENNEDE
ncbi:MAG: hypothetical protein ACKVOR_13820, partial [Flavobacteriales bacterium]